MKCWICGQEADYERPAAYLPNEEKSKARFEKKDYSNYRAYCKVCFKKHTDEVKLDRENYAKLKKKVMFERALELMEKQGCEMAKHRTAAGIVQKHLYSNLDAFDSADEIIAAIVLITNGIKVRPQYKVGPYQVDLLVPDLKIALEIDGIHHAGQRYKESARDKEIKVTLGEGWEVVRIGTKHIEENAEKLLPAIQALKEFKQI